MCNLEYSFLKSSIFLITGGAGFIGSNIVEKLLDIGYKVRVLDNFSTGIEENISTFYKNPNFELIKGDIRSIDDCKKACKKVDYVLHQAALGSIPRSIKHPLETNEVNISGTLNMLNAARENNVKRFVYATSSSVYGDDTTLPKIEKITGTPLSPYAITKRTNEMYGYLFYKLYDLQTIGLRYFNVYGKNQNYNSSYAAVIPKFIVKLLNNEQPVIHGDGEQSRDFTYIEDVVQANLKACIASRQDVGEVFNIAYGKSISLNKLYRKICELLKVNIKPYFGPARAGDVKCSFANITKAKKILNYCPKHDIDAGLRQTIEWYKNKLNSNV